MRCFSICCSFKLVIMSHKAGMYLNLHEIPSRFCSETFNLLETPPVVISFFTSFNTSNWALKIMILMTERRKCFVRDFSESSFPSMVEQIIRSIKIFMSFLSVLEGFNISLYERTIMERKRFQYSFILRHTYPKKYAIILQLCHAFQNAHL